MDSHSEDTTPDRFGKFARVVQSTLNGFDSAIASLMERVNEHDTRIEQLEAILAKKAHHRTVDEQYSQLKSEIADMRNSIKLRMALFSALSAAASVATTLILLALTGG